MCLSVVSRSLPNVTGPVGHAYFLRTEYKSRVAEQHNELLTEDSPHSVPLKHTNDYLSENQQKDAMSYHCILA